VPGHQVTAGLAGLPCREDGFSVTTPDPFAARHLLQASAAQAGTDETGRPGTQRARGGAGRRLPHGRQCWV